MEQLNLDGILRFRGRICVLVEMKLKKLILEKRHKSGLSPYLDMTKMYHEERCISKFLTTCLTCQKAKIKHQRTRGTLQQL